MKNKKSFAKATCDHCGERVEVDAAPLLLSGKSTVACPHCGKDFTISLAGARAPRKRETTASPERRAETRGELWESGEISIPEPAEAGTEEPEEEAVELPFQPLLSQPEETTRNQARQTARVPFAPLQTTPTPTPSTAATKAGKKAAKTPDGNQAEKPALGKSSFYQWVFIVVAIALIAIGLYFLPLGEREQPPDPSKNPPAQGGGDPGKLAPEEETIELLDPALFDPPVREVRFPVAVVAESPYPFPSPSRYEP